MELYDHQSEVHSVALDLSANLVLSGSSDGTVAVWDVTGAQIARLAGHTAEVYGVAVVAARPA